MSEAVTVLYAAILVESLVNLVRTVKDDEIDWRYWAALFIAVGVSLLVTYNWDIDLFSMLLGEGKLPLVGAILTGFIIARGANVVSDLLKLANAAREKLVKPDG